MRPSLNHSNYLCCRFRYSAVGTDATALLAPEAQYDNRDKSDGGKIFHSSGDLREKENKEHKTRVRKRKRSVRHDCELVESGSTKDASTIDASSTITYPAQRLDQQHESATDSGE